MIIWYNQVNNYTHTDILWVLQTFLISSLQLKKIVIIIHLIISQYIILISYLKCIKVYHCNLHQLPNQRCPLLYVRIKSLQYLYNTGNTVHKKSLESESSRFSFWIMTYNLGKLGLVIQYLKTFLSSSAKWVPQAKLADVLAL